MSERKWSCGCYEHDGVVTPCKVDPKLNPTCFRLKEAELVERPTHDLDPEAVIPGVGHSDLNGSAGVTYVDPVKNEIGFEAVPKDETQS